MLCLFLFRDFRVESAGIIFMLTNESRCGEQHCVAVIAPPSGSGKPQVVSFHILCLAD